MLEILEECCGLETASFQAAVDEYHQAYKQAVQNRTAQLKEHLAQNHSVAGTAVIPNLDADEQWQQAAQDMRRQFENNLNRVADGLRQ
jgi:TRAP-type C4-dicarboxylate transport system substrate-binding protein